MIEGHKDNPTLILEYIDTLDSYERNIFQKGYIIALYRLLEQLTDSKSKIASKIMDAETSEAAKTLLQSRIEVLDVYESHYTNVIADLEGKSQLQS